MSSQLYFIFKVKSWNFSVYVGVPVCPSCGWWGEGGVLMFYFLEALLLIFFSSWFNLVELTVSVHDYYNASCSVILVYMHYNLLFFA